MQQEGKLMFYSLVLGILHTFLFFHKDLGVSYFIFMSFLLGSLVYWFHQGGELTRSRAWFFSIPIILLSARFLISSSMRLIVMNQLVIIVLFIGMSMLLKNPNKMQWGRIEFLKDIVLMMALPIQYCKKPYQWIYHKMNIKKDARWIKGAYKVLLGIFISAPLLLIIIGLLSSADMVFNNLLLSIPEKILSNLQDSTLTSMMGKIFTVLIVGTYAFGYAWNLNEQEIHDDEQQTEQNLLKAQLDQTILITMLTMINIVYIVFSYIQFSYLFGKNMGGLPVGITYSEYARRGFFELLFVTAINFGIILLTLFFAQQQSKRFNPILKSLLYMIGIATYIMIYSSYYRMGLYQQNYGYTYLRMLVYFFLFLETFLLAATLLFIIRPKFQLGKVYVIMFLIFYVGFNYLNIDRFIAKKNIDLYFQTNKIDLYYIQVLSYDVVPEMMRLLDAKDPAVVKETKNYLLQHKETLEQNKPWQSFNYSEYRAKKLVKSIEK